MSLHDELAALAKKWREFADELHEEHELEGGDAYYNCARGLDAILAKYADLFSDTRTYLSYDYMRDHDEIDLLDKYEDLLRRLVDAPIDGAKAEEK